MKIALIYSGARTAAWSVSDGLVFTLRNMGHEVVAFPRGRGMETVRVTAEAINACDLLIMSGTEWLFRDPKLAFLEELIEQSEFKVESTLTPVERVKQLWGKYIKVPVASIYHESFVRPDQTIDFRLFKDFSDVHFFPAVQDADRFNEPEFARGRCHWLPFGVDTTVFHPPRCSACAGTGHPYIEAHGVRLMVQDKKKDCPKCLGAGWVKAEKSVRHGFIGLMYPTREAWLGRLRPHLHDVALMAGQVHVQDFDGYPWLENVQRLAANYRRIAVFLNLPTLSQLLVTKVYEVMACGTFLMTPFIEDDGEPNCDQFVHGQHLAYYRQGDFPRIRDLAFRFGREDEAREEIARAGCVEVLKKHSLTARMEKVLEVMGERKKQVESVKEIAECVQP